MATKHRPREIGGQIVYAELAQVSQAARRSATL